MHSSQTIGQFSTCHFFLSLLETRVGKHWQPPFFIKQFQILSTFISFGGLYKHNIQTQCWIEKGYSSFQAKAPQTQLTLIPCEKTVLLILCGMFCLVKQSNLSLYTSL